MSLNIPAAVTWAPAPGPRTMSGWLLYLLVVNAIMLSDPDTCANGSSFLYFLSSTTPFLFLTSTTPTYLNTFKQHQKLLLRKPLISLKVNVIYTLFK